MAEFQSGKSPGDPGQGADKSDLTDFGARLRQTQQAHMKPVDRSSGRGTSMGMAFRLTTELVAGLVVGGGIGLGLDKWLGTGPIFLLIFFVLGMAAGILNVFRTAKQLTAQAERDAGGNQGGSSN